MNRLTKLISTFVLMSYIISIVFSLNFSVKYNAFLAEQLENFNGSNEMLKCKVHCFLIENEKIDDSSDSIDDIGIERYLTDKHLLSAADFYFSLKFEVESFTYNANLIQHPKTIIIPPPEFL